MGLSNMRKYICEYRGDKLYVRGACCVNRETGELKEDYSDWIVRELDVPTPGILADEGRLIWRVAAKGIVVREPSDLTAKEIAAKEKAEYAKRLLEIVAGLEEKIRILELKKGIEIE